MTRAEYLERIRKEQATFEEMLPELLKKHPNKVAVLHEGELLGTFDNYGEAYAFAVAKLGLDEPFLIEPLLPPRVESISVAWDAGVMFA